MAIWLSRDGRTAAPGGAPRLPLPWLSWFRARAAVIKDRAAVIKDRGG